MSGDEQRPGAVDLRLVGASEFSDGSGIERLRLAERLAFPVEGLCIDLAALGIDGGNDRPAPMHFVEIGGHDCERRHANGGNPERQRQATRGGNAGADAGEGAWADGDHNSRDVGKGPSRLSHDLFDHIRQTLGMALADPLTTLGKDLPGRGVIKRGGAIHARRIQCQDDHGTPVPNAF